MIDRHVTLADVARLASVSPTTVSRVMNNDPRISERTRQSVLLAARRLGYVPDARASSLRKRATRSLGLLIPDVTDPMHGQLAVAVEREAAAQGYTVLLANGFRDPQIERQALTLFAAHRTEGIVVASSGLSPAETTALLNPSHVIFVTPEHIAHGRSDGAAPAGYIYTDNVGGVEAAVQHLLKCGYRRIAYVSGPDIATNSIRRDTTLRALAAAELPGTMYHYPGGIETWGADNALVATIVANRPEALICYDDVVALGMIDALRAQGVRVPDDLAIVGFDDIPFAAISHPRLTTVAQPSDEMGRRAINLLLTAIQQGKLPPGVILPVRLVVRETTGCPPPTSPASS